MRSFRPLAALTITLLLTGARVAAGQCGAVSLCPAGQNPCVVGADVTFAGNATCDLGGRALTIATGKQIRVTGGWSLRIENANGITLSPNARILAVGAGEDSGGAVTLVSLADILIDAGARIDVSGALGGGAIDLQSGGNVVVSGRLLANNDGSANADGGRVEIDAVGNVTLGADGVLVVIDTSGGSGDIIWGGDVDVVAGGALFLRSRIETRGQTGGAVTLGAGAALHTTAAGDIDATAIALAGDGGPISLTAGGDLLAEGDVVSSTNGKDEGTTGYAGDASLVALGALTLVGKIDVGGGTYGAGGLVTLEGTGVTLNGSINTRGIADYAGDVGITTSGPVTITNVIDARGAIGGFIDVVSGGAVVVATGSEIHAEALAGGQGGYVGLLGCTVSVQPGAMLVATGAPDDAFPRGAVQVSASSSMTIGGKLQSTIRNQLDWRDVPPTILGTATITPAATVLRNLNLPCCVDCPIPTTTTSTTLITTTTLATTTTTLATTTTTTTTSTLPPTTTTTLAPASTTTSTTSPSTTTTSATSPSSTTTTSTTSPSSTTTTSTTSPSSTTSTTQEPTTTTTGPEPTTTTSTTLAPPATTTTTTTTAPIPTTTTTAPPASCLEEPLVGFEAVGCRLDLVTATFVETPAEALGGPRAVQQLTARVARARRFVDRARLGKKVTPSLKRAGRELKGLGRAIAKGERKGKIAAGLATPLVALVSGAEIELGTLRATLR